MIKLMIDYDNSYVFQSIDQFLLYGQCVLLLM